MDTGALADIREYVADRLSAAVISQTFAFGELTLRVRRERIVEVLTRLRDDPECAFAQLIDLCVVDYPERADRFDVVYHLLSLKQNVRIRVVISTDESTPAPTVTGLFPASDWYEREAFDMYGVVFDGHPDLRRILTDYGFHGHPLRKDFPLTGYVEVRYDEERKRVIYEPVKLVQEFRDFDFLSPWEGAHLVPHGDEKADKSEGGA